MAKSYLWNQLRRSSSQITGDRKKGGALKQVVS